MCAAHTAVKGTLQFYRRACPVLNVNGADLRPSHAPRRHLTPRIEPSLCSECALLNSFSRPKY